MKKIVLSAACILALVAGQAQSFATDYLRAGDAYYAKGDYYSAAQYYEKYFSTAKTKTAATTGFTPYTVQGGAKASAKATTSTSRQQALFNLAESYRLLNYHEKAAPLYKQLLEDGTHPYPLARFHYAAALRALAQYPEAEASFQSFLTQYTTSDAYTEAAKREVENLRFIQQQLGRKDLSLYTVNKLGSEVNQEGASYAPVLVNSTLYFTSTRPDGSAAKNSVHQNRVYEAAYQAGTVSGITRTALPQPKEGHQGTVALSADGGTLFLTRWSTKGEKKTASLYSATKTTNGWSEPTPLDASINAPGYSSQQPFVSGDGRYLYFVSDRPGGQGGLDVWVAELDAQGRPSNPRNLGAAINTRGDEEAPYYHAPSRTLVFSSDGRVGMGGQDLFSAAGTPGNWGEPVNMGYPVNSTKDDVYFVSTGGARNILENVLLSSDRSAACCLELFSLSKKRPVKQISGRVVACETGEPLSGASLSIVDAGNQPVFNKVTDASGAYSFTVEDFAPLKASATREGYRAGALEVAVPRDEETTILTNPAICLSKIPEVGQTEVLNNVYYEFNKAYLLDASFASLDKLVALLRDNPSVTIEIGGHTDSKGADAYNQRLSEARAQSVVDYLVGKGIDKTRLVAKGYGETVPVAPNQNADGSDNPEGREKNRRTEFKVLSK